MEYGYIISPVIGNEGRLYIVTTPKINVTSEIMLGQILESLNRKPSEKLRNTIINIISQYDVRPLLNPCGPEDLQQKIKLFLDGKRLEGIANTTLKSYATELRVFSRHVPKAASEITTGDIRGYLSECNHLKTSSLSKRMSVLKSLFGWLSIEEIIPLDPTRRIKALKKEKRIPKALTIEELEMLREACITSRERALIEVLYATGCRLSEVQRMNRSDIDFQAMDVLVIGKGNKERPVYFSFKAVYHLKKYLNLRSDDEEALIITERKPYRRLSGKGIQREIKVISSRSGIKKNVHPHILRHTFATLMLNNGANITAVQELLGHSNPATTQVYASMTGERVRQSHRQYLVQ